MSTISEYIRAKGYSFKKARRVLKSPDPDYREELEEITKILSNLREDEKFFSVDEFGPFSIKMQGGRSFSPKGITRVIPQKQRSKGRLILTGVHCREERILQAESQAGRKQNLGKGTRSA